MDKLLREVKEKSSKQNKMSDEDFNLPINEFILSAYLTCYPNTYGILFAKKVIQLSNGALKPMNPKLDCGDAFHYENGTRKYSEIKISFLNNGGKFRITNIRCHQNMDYFILCFVDRVKNFKPKFYVVPKEVITDNNMIHLTPMNGTAQANMNNEIVPMSTTIDAFDIDWLFGKHNLLSNTTTTTFLKFLSSLKPNTTLPSYIPYTTENSKKRQPKTKIWFRIQEEDGSTTSIEGETNARTMVLLVKHLGAKNIEYAYWPAWLSKEPNKYRTEYVGDGYYLFPKMSLRDTKSIIEKINMMTPFDVKMYNSKNL